MLVRRWSPARLRLIFTRVAVAITRRWVYFPTMVTIIIWDLYSSKIKCLIICTSRGIGNLHRMYETASQNITAQRSFGSAQYFKTCHVELIEDRLPCRIYFESHRNLRNQGTAKALQNTIAKHVSTDTQARSPRCQVPMTRTRDDYKPTFHSKINGVLSIRFPRHGVNGSLLYITKREYSRHH